MAATIDWTAVSAVATLVVAAATLILAIATRRLARSTKEEVEAVRREAEATEKLARSTTEEVEAVRRQAEATEKQAEITARALAASSRPWLTAHPGPLRDPGNGKEIPQVGLAEGVTVNYQEGIRGHVAVKNVGLGLAVIPKDSSRAWGREGPNSRDFSLTRFVFPRSSVLASGESTLLEFFVSNVALQGFVGSQFGYDFFVHVLYTDADGGQPTVASFRVSAYPDRDPSIFEIAYRHLDAVPSLTDAYMFDKTEPFAIVRLGLPE